jgi:hypothetical protein
MHTSNINQKGVAAQSKQLPAVAASGRLRGSQQFLWYSHDTCNSQQYPKAAVSGCNSQQYDCWAVSIGGSHATHHSCQGFDRIPAASAKQPRALSRRPSSSSRAQLQQ